MPAKTVDLGRKIVRHLERSGGGSVRVSELQSMFAKARKTGRIFPIDVTRTVLRLLDRKQLVLMPDRSVKLAAIQGPIRSSTRALPRVHAKKVALPAPTR